MVRPEWWKKMHDKEILDKYVDLDKSYLTDTEKKQIMNMLYKYKYAFSLRDKIDTCPNISAFFTMISWYGFILPLVSSILFMSCSNY